MDRQARLKVLNYWNWLLLQCISVLGNQVPNIPAFLIPVRVWQYILCILCSGFCFSSNFSDHQSIHCCEIYNFSKYILMRTHLHKTTADSVASKWEVKVLKISSVTPGVSCGCWSVIRVWPYLELEFCDVAGVSCAGDFTQCYFSRLFCTGGMIWTRSNQIEFLAQLRISCGHLYQIL